MAAVKLTPEIAGLMRREIALQKTYASLNDDQGFLDSDDQFHALIARAAGFESIWDDVREAKFHMDRVRRLSLLSQQHMLDLVAEHEEILGKLVAHDVDGADKSIASHLTSVMHELDLIRARAPQYFIGDNAQNR
ncbi:FCD domain-containing protein [Devosia algicola]|uniref:FCD domain-containing protein n=1 Tax=Devosia algicola TaxID=3026418 RepID=A0ABY7YLU7_9HYPH|nr:FCD domain-containing protein [Devosia algicola]WDR02034.1 FCD domain-containing protein [Devosia algicola]